MIAQHLLAFILLWALSPAIFAQYWLETKNNKVENPDTLAAWRRLYIEGFTQKASFKVGETIEFRISSMGAIGSTQRDTTFTTCTIKIYKVTHYWDLNYDDSVCTISADSVTFHPLRDSLWNPMYPVDNSTNYFSGHHPFDYRWGCLYWNVNATWTVPSSTPPGMYYAKVINVSGSNNVDSCGFIPFVIKSDPFSATDKKALLVVAWNTWQAYNYWGGASLYPDISGGHYGTFGPGRKVTTVSFHRPFGFVTHGDNIASTALGQLNFRERKLISWAEQNGYELDFCVDADIDNNNNNFINRYKSIIFAGHSGYWTSRERNNLTGEYPDFSNTALEFGVNLIFLSANNCYWKIQYNFSDIAMDNPDTMYIDKGYIDTADLWRRQHHPITDSLMYEANFIGAQFYAVNKYAVPQKVTDSSHWLFRGTGLHNGSTFGSFLDGNTVRYICDGEGDMMRADYHSPNIRILASEKTADTADRIHWGEWQGEVYSQMVYQENENTNSRVFAAGCMQWNQGLYPESTYDSSVIRITKNLFDHFLYKKYIGKILAPSLNNKCKWTESILLDGNVNLLGNSYLDIGNASQQVILTIDSSFFVEGNLTIPSSCTVQMKKGVGDGVCFILPGSKVMVETNSTLVIDTNCNFILKDSIYLGAGAKLIIKGYLDIEQNDNARITGPGQVIIEPTGWVHLEGNDTLNIENTGGFIVRGPITVEDTALLYVAENATLTVDDGTNTNASFSFGVKSNFLVNGTAELVGTPARYLSITSTNTAASWGSLIFDGHGAEASHLNYVRIKNGTEVQFLSNDFITLENSTLENMQSGIYIYNAQPYILNDSIIDPEYDGIYGQGTGMEPRIYDNVIMKTENLPLHNEGIGIYLINYIYPMVVHNDISGFDQGMYFGGGSYTFFCKTGNTSFGANNRFTNNNTNLSVGWGSTLDGGADSSSGKNSFYNQGSNIFAYQDSWVMANWNYWDGDTVGTFWCDQSSEIDATDPLENDPWESAKNNQFVINSHTNAENEKTGDPRKVYLLNAQSLENQGRIREAIAVYKEMIKNDIVPEIALTSLAKIALKSHQDDLLTYISGFASSTVHNGMTIRGNKLLGGISAQRGANDNAIWYFDKVITMASDDYEGNNARFDKFFVTLNGKKDIPAATRILNEIKSLDFTDKELVNRIGIAERMLTNGKAVTKNLSKSTNTNTTRAPMEYALYQNFPNPFNPYTTINYQIKFDGLVSLKIYDMLGREVKTLVNEEQTAGKYSIIFDGSTLASGVYFYTLRSGEYSTTKKLLLIK